MSFETFNSIVQIVAEIIVLLLGGFLVPYLKAKMGEQKYNDILTKVEKGVSAAEQIYKAMEKGDEKNKLRYEYALQYVTDYLQKKKIDIDEEELKTLIESAVDKLNKKIIQ